MNILPIISRELRILGRRSWIIWLRVSGAFFCAASIGLFSIDGHPSVEAGADLFVLLHFSTLLAIWVLVPLMVSDTISSERREGTLGLLFLTPLTPIEVITGKAMGHLVVAMTLWVGTFPVLAVPLMMGGVSLADLQGALILEGCSILLALSAGLLASSLSREQTWSAGLSLILAALMVMGSKWTIVWIVETMVVPVQVSGGYGPVLSQTIFYPGTGGVVFVNVPMDPRQPGITSVVNVAVQDALKLARTPSPGGLVRNWSQSFSTGQITVLTTYLPSPPSPPTLVWSQLVGLTGPAGSLSVWWMVQSAALPLSLVLTLALMRLTAARVASSIREGIRTVARESRYQRLFRQGYLQHIFHRRVGRLLDHNPIIWLQSYSNEARLGKWGWCLLSAVVICVLVPFVGESWAGKGIGVLIYVVLGGLAYNTARSFAEDKRSGALELILITPIKEHQFIVGRLLGLWSSFVPTLVVIVIGCVAEMAWTAEFGEAVLSEEGIGSQSNLIALISGWACLPAIGLALALRQKNVLLASIGAFMLWLLPVVGLKLAWHDYDYSSMAPLRGIFRLGPGVMLGIACWPFFPRAVPARMFLGCLWMEMVLMLPPVYFFRLDWSESTGLTIFNQVAIAVMSLSFLFRQLRERRFVIDGGAG